MLFRSRIEHAGRGGVEAGCGGTFHRFAGEALGDETAEAVQVDQVGEFEAITERSAGGKDRIPQAQRANSYTQINRLCCTHIVERISRSRT